jgi:hypothetical protein
LSFFGSRIHMLEREGYIEVVYSERYLDGKQLKQIDSMVLTLKGEQELNDLRSKDFIPSVWSRIKNLGWVIATSIITSAITVLVLNKLGPKT